MNARPLLFLDFDGVLNSSRFFVRRGHEPNGTRRESEIADIDPDAVSRLNRIVEATRCDVVVSSTWRLGRTLVDLREILQARGFKGRVVGKTPDLYQDREFGEKHLRAHDISAYLQTHLRAVPRFAIVDDDTDAGVGYEANFVKTHVTEGLTDVEVANLIEMLSPSIDGREL